MSKFFAAFVLCFGLIALTSAIPSNLMRILNGAEAAIAQFPYLVSIRKGEVHWCGGSIISNRYILAAAHCVGYKDAKNKYIYYDVKNYTIRAGSNERLSGGVIVKVAEFVANENYNDDVHDLSTLRLETPLVFSNTIKAITLDTKEVPVGATVTLAGWGRLSTKGDLANKLLYATAVVMSRKACYDAIELDSGDIFCLSRPVNNGACNGDSGGPAVLGGKLVGVASFVVGGGCGLDYPDGFAKISTHIDWIRKHSDVK